MKEKNVWKKTAQSEYNCCVDCYSDAPGDGGDGDGDENVPFYLNHSHDDGCDCWFHYKKRKEKTTSSGDGFEEKRMIDDNKNRQDMERLSFSWISLQPDQRLFVSSVLRGQDTTRAYLHILLMEVTLISWTCSPYLGQNPSSS